jgi:6-phosphogluconolactonase (cycloisomerase 2 family)
MIPDSIQEGNYPDDWYMGTVWFNDTLWQFNLSEGISTQIGIFPEQIDGYKLSASSSGKYVYVVNRLNDNLWVVNLEK